MRYDEWAFDYEDSDSDGDPYEDFGVKKTFHGTRGYSVAVSCLFLPFS